MSPRDHKPRLDGAQLAALLIETLLNGVFWVLLVQSFQAMVYRARTRRERFIRPMSLTAMFLFVTITAHWILDCVTTFDAFIRPQASFCIEANALNPAEKVYLSLADPKSVTNSALYVMSTLIGDAFMIYRLYIVWGRNKFIVIPPIILCTALAVTGGVVTYLFSQATQPIFATAGAWITSSFVLTFLCNLYSTSLIAIKIFFSNREMGRTHTGNYNLTKIMEILVESAAFYSCCVILALATYVADSNVQFAVVAANNPVIGIIFCMIVTRAHNSTTATNAGNSTPSTNYRSRITAQSVALRPMAVKITTHVEGDIEEEFKGGDFGTPPASPCVYPMTLHSSIVSVGSVV